VERRAYSTRSLAFGGDLAGAHCRIERVHHHVPDGGRTTGLPPNPTLKAEGHRHRPAVTHRPCHTSLDTGPYTAVHLRKRDGRLNCRFREGDGSMKDRMHMKNASDPASRNGSPITAALTHAGMEPRVDSVEISPRESFLELMNEGLGKASYPIGVERSRGGPLDDASRRPVGSSV
jgi:hypothetical protein